jgi:hypothetical protein
LAIKPLHRKLLWGRSAGHCAICKCVLTDEATDADDPEVVIGEEAHIVSGRKSGPRYRPMAAADLDHYRNLIILCPNDHSRVDKQVRLYSEVRLQEIKRDHERWARALRQAPLPVRLHDLRPGKAIPLSRIETGAAFVAEFGGCHGLQHKVPDDLTDDEIDIASDFLQDMTDWMDLWSGLGPGEQLRATRDIGRHIGELRDVELALYAGTRHQILEGGIGHPQRWRMAVLVIDRMSNDQDDEGKRWAIIAPGS